MSRHRAPEDTAVLAPAPRPRVRPVLQAGIPAWDDLTVAARRPLPPVPPVVTR